MIADPPGPPEPGCTDGAVCHHKCETHCWRVLNCGPLSSYYDANHWPDALIAEHRDYATPRDKEG
ncbi:MAG: hypothetical protein AAGC86_06975 [Pseudomonadota bacterium]